MRKPIPTLSPLQAYVTLECGTEPPFANAYWDNKCEGVYVDVISGEPLFASVHKFDSGTGWPSFTRPLDAASVSEHEDVSHGMQRVEVKSASSGAHLGHVFDDGPRAEGGLRYCINSAALHFVAKDELLASGYGEWLALFD